LPLVKVIVVPKESAVISGELSYPIRSNHVVSGAGLVQAGHVNAIQDMTKFADRRAPGYEDVVGEIKRLASNVHAGRTHPGQTGEATQPDSAATLRLDHHESATQMSPSQQANLVCNHSSGVSNTNTGQGSQNNNTGNGKQYVGETLYFGRHDS
jgi:hypothetical protein